MAHLIGIVAMDAQRGIGVNNTLPWHLKEDLAHFKRTTLGHPVIMGRKTFDSIGKPLPNRRNIVITRNPNWRHDGVEAVTSIDDALKLVGDVQAYVIGGAQIFAETLPYTELLIVTEIDKTFDCDTFFPLLKPQQWQEVTREQYYSAEHGFSYAFVTLQRT
jgi:dihydrofolate reductase